MALLAMFPALGLLVLLAVAGAVHSGPVSAVHIDEPAEELSIAA